MPSVQLHGPSKDRAAENTNNPLPQLLQTPSGLAVLEIQGTLNAPAPSTAEGDPDQEATASAPPVGKLVFPLYDSDTAAEDTAWQKRVHLYVGRHQRMTGEVKKLAKPLALIRRRNPEASSGAPGGDLEVAEIVYYKLIFAHRPEPVGTALS